MSLPQGVHQSHILLRTIPLWSQVLPAPTEQMVLLGYVTCWRLVTTTNLPAPPQRWDLSGVMGGIVTKILCLAEPVVGLLNFLLDPSMHFLVKSSPSKSDGEGNGTPLQYSCLENPRDGGACWAAVYGAAQSRTRLKRLSSSKSDHPLSEQGPCPPPSPRHLITLACLQQVLLEPCYPMNTITTLHSSFWELGMSHM